MEVQYDEDNRSRWILRAMEDWQDYKGCEGCVCVPILKYLADPESNPD